jgi:hypothetical protein
MKKAAIALVLVITAIGCSQKDGQFAFRAPGADKAAALSTSAAPKPGIPTPKPDQNPPQTLK